MELLLKFLVGLFALLALLAVAGVVYQAIGRALDARRYPPPGRLVDVGGHRLHIHALPFDRAQGTPSDSRGVGAGGPTVVLDAGLPASSITWGPVQHEVAKFTHVCSYDRAGQGWSEPGPRPRTTSQIVEELHTLLHNAGIPQPYVLVGASFGGFTARLYAARYPEEVAGMVLVDPIHPSEWLELPQDRAHQMKRIVWVCRRAAWLARLGVLRLYYLLLIRRVVKVRQDDPRLVAILRLPAEARPLLRPMWSRPEPIEAVADQLEALGESARQVAACGSLGDLPLVVLSASNPGYLRVSEQEAAARLSTRGEHRIASHSSHWIQIDQPEVVVEAIRDVVERLRGERRPAPLRIQ